MVFYVHSGRGTVSWVSDGETIDLEVKRGDIYRIGSGSVFYVRSHPDPLRQKLRIHAIFTTSTSEASPEALLGAYSNLADLVRGFDEGVLRMGFRVSEEVISGLKSAERPLSIVPFTAGNEADSAGWKEGIFEALMGVGRPLGSDNGKKKKEKTKGKAFNILDVEPDVQNCNGQSIAVTDKEFHALKGSDVGVFMVNLTKGSMMGPHWNPRATEIAIVTHGEGMVQVVLPRVASSGERTRECLSWRFRVREGDVFLVSRYHAMAQMSFNNGSLSFVGFSTKVRKNRPQFLAGKRSVLQTLDRDILALSLGVSNTTVDKLLAPQGEAIMLDCTSCAEQEWERMAEDIEKQRRREEEEARRKEEEEARRREEEEAEVRKREEEEEERRREEKRKRKQRPGRGRRKRKRGEGKRKRRLRPGRGRRKRKRGDGKRKRKRGEGKRKRKRGEGKRKRRLRPGRRRKRRRGDGKRKRKQRPGRGRRKRKRGEGKRKRRLRPGRGRRKRKQRPGRGRSRNRGEGRRKKKDQGEKKSRWRKSQGGKEKRKKLKDGRKSREGVNRRKMGRPSR
ncbi:unnamed protein product [Spirodela intermedia]|uniref:Cupin type-1 domain-containing protein n=1 Tax=Spirodela intermedia TaxID=51605 RepID=A0A7I8IKM8_SPIIN|nr:unnamed protein product [Spirodela intermedia]CAA6657557.1 unnamed protein product [Spirodela intermedia]